MTNNTLINIKIITGSTREGRFSDRAAAWIAEEVKKQEGVTITQLIWWARALKNARQGN